MIISVFFLFCSRSLPSLYATGLSRTPSFCCTNRYSYSYSGSSVCISSRSFSYCFTTFSGCAQSAVLKNLCLYIFFLMKFFTCIFSSSDICSVSYSILSISISLTAGGISSAILSSFSQRSSLKLASRIRSITYRVTVTAISSVSIISGVTYSL